MLARPARLVISNEEGVLLQVRLGRLFDLNAEPVTLGRAGDNMVISPDRRTSRHHARIRAVPPSPDGGEGGYEVEDAGSTYGTLLNGRPITRERLGHNDMVDCGGLRVLFQLIEDRDAAVETEVTAASAESAGAAKAAEAEELREQVHRLIDEEAQLRQAVGRAQEAEQLAGRRLTEALDETTRLRGVVDDLRKEGEAMKGRIEVLGQELRNERGQRAGQGQREQGEALAEAQRSLERQRQRTSELEAREGELVLEVGRLKKETEHLREMNAERDRRQSDLPQALQRAAKRIQELSVELEKNRMLLAQAQGDLDALRRGGR